MNELKYKAIEKSFKLERYKLLSKNLPANGYLKYICPHGHKHKIRIDSWYLGSRCKDCYDNRRRISPDIIKNSFEKEGYKLLSKKYINNKHYLKYICLNGHRHSIKWNDWNSGVRCKECVDELQRIPFEIIYKSFNREGYVLLSKKYINNQSHLKYKCTRNHICKTTWSRWKSGHRCGKCSSIISKGEKQVVKFVKSLKFKVVENDRKTIVNPTTKWPLELDIFIPKLKKAIEYNGTYWHAGKYKNPNDALKKVLCKKKKIKLLVISELDWKTKCNRCKNRISKFLVK